MDFSKNLNESISACIFYQNNKYSNFNTSVYPFTTENISGYINNFDLENKSLFTVGSSGDQAINASLHNCKDITLYDINPYLKYYYYLKVAALINLTRSEFFEFLRYKDYLNNGYNKNVFNLELYNKIKDTLRLLDYESFLYYDELFNTFDGVTIRKALFIIDDEDSSKVLMHNNEYLRNELLYDEVKQKIKKVRLNFICDDIFDLKNNKKYDNMWLSNILTWFSNKEKILKLIDKSYDCLNEDGKLLVSYLYKIGESYKLSHSPVYDLDNIFIDLSNYNLKLEVFEGVLYDSWISLYRKDGALILKK